MNRAQRRLMSKQNGVPSQIPPQGTKAEFYQGSVPPPAMLKDFSVVNESFPERIFKMAEDAGVRQMKQLENQELQIKLDAENRRLEIEASERLKAMEIRGRNTDSILKGLTVLSKRGIKTMEKQNIEEFVERNAVGAPKSSMFTVNDAIALHPNMVFTTPTQIPEVLELRKIVSKLISDIELPVKFYSDAVSCALFDYRHSHKNPMGQWLCIALQVFTCNGDELVYTEKLHSVDIWRVEGLEAFCDEVVSPSSLRLMRNVAQDVKFEDVQQVIAYVYETSGVLDA